MGYFEKFNNKGVPFMDGAEKQDISTVYGQELHITDFGFINGDNGEFGVIQLAEHPGKFFFVNKIATEMLREVQADDKKSELANEVIVFEQRTSQNGRVYTAFTFPNA